MKRQRTPEEQAAACQYRLARLDYTWAIEDAERRAANGEQQVFCELCQRYQWTKQLCARSKARGELETTMQHRGRNWRIVPTGNPDRPFTMISGTISIDLVRLNPGRAHELTPMNGQKQQTARYGLFSDESGQPQPLEIDA